MSAVFTGARSGLGLEELIRRGRSWQMEFFYGAPAYYHAGGCEKDCGETCNEEGRRVALDASDVWHSKEGRAEWRRQQADAGEASRRGAEAQSKAVVEEADKASAGEDEE